MLLSASLFLTLVGLPSPSVAAAVGSGGSGAKKVRRAVSADELDGFRAASGCGGLGYGPLDYRTQSPFLAFRQPLRPASAAGLKRGRVEAAIRGTLANIWALNPGSYRIDLETLQTAAAVRYGLTDRVLLEIEVDRRSRFGGFLDRFIVSSHERLGVDQSGRDEAQRNDFSLDLDPGQGRSVLSLRDSDRGVFERAVTFRAQHTLSCGKGRLPALSYSATVRYKQLDLSAASPFSGDYVDAGGALTASKSWRRFVFHLVLGHAYHADERLGEIRLRNSQVSVASAVEWRRGRKSSWVLQYLVTQGAFNELGKYRRSSNEILLGWKREINPRLLIEVAIVENLAVSPNSPDFGIHLGCSTRF